jgi:hypothetical protein
MRSTITHLKNVEVFAKQARIDAQAAVEHLTGARKARAEQVVDMLAEAAHHAGRLAFVITGNVRAEEVAEARRLVNPAWAAIKTEALLPFSHRGRGSFARP